MLNIAVVPLVLDAPLVLQWRLFWELSLCMKVASSRSGLLATALVSKAALLSRPSRSHTRTSLVRSLLVAQREEQKAGLAPHRVLKNGYAKKNGCCHFFLTLRHDRTIERHSGRTSVCGLRFRFLNNSRCRRSAAT